MAEKALTDERGSRALTPLMLKFTTPCVISLLVGALYNIVDQIFIANASYLGSYGNAANNVVYPLTVIALAIAVTFGDGESAYLSILLGSNDRDGAHKSVGTQISSVVTVSIIITAVYALFQDQLITLLGGTVNAKTFAYAKEYFTWITAGIPFYMFGQSMAGTVNADGNPRYSMCCTLAGALTNTILDPIFIFVFHWGMMGAALATILGQILVAGLFAAYLRRLKNVRLTRASFGIRTEYLKRIISLGLNTFLAQFSIVLSMAACNNLARIYGARDAVFSQVQYSQIPTAVLGIVMKFFQIVVSVAVGISAGSIPIVGFNYGAGRNDRVIGVLKRMLIAETVLGLGALCVFEGMPGALVRLFGSANESVYYSEFAVKCIRTFLCLIMLTCFNKCVTIFMQALGRPAQAVVISMVREVVFGVGLPIALCMVMGLDGLLFSMPVAEFLTMFLSVPLLILVYRSLKAAGVAAPLGDEMVPAGAMPAGVEIAAPAGREAVMPAGREVVAVREVPAGVEADGEAAMLGVSRSPRVVRHTA